MSVKQKITAMELGKQYLKDDEFKKKARLHQSYYRANILKVGFNEYGNRLLDGNANLNYFPKLGVIEDLRTRYPNYSSKRDADMLRSEHIPFNVFSPLKLDLEVAKNVFNNLLNNIILEVIAIKIEYAPSPKQKYLNDGTSFDSYIEFIHIDGSKGALGIEVKYTEQAYSLGENEKKSIENINSPYYLVAKKSELYIKNATDTLIEDNFRQIWRNHLLGESMKLNNEINHFISLTLYPSGNTHFNNVIPKYLELLQPKKLGSFKAVSFEELFLNYAKYATSNEFTEWIDFLKNRYLVK